MSSPTERIYVMQYSAYRFDEVPSPQDSGFGD